MIESLREESISYSTSIIQNKDERLFWTLSFQCPINYSSLRVFLTTSALDEDLYGDLVFEHLRYQVCIPHELACDYFIVEHLALLVAQ